MRHRLKNTSLSSPTRWALTGQYMDFSEAKGGCDKVIHFLCSSLDYAWRYSRSLKATSRQPTYHFHPMCVGTEIMHLAYADDLLLFARADKSTIILVVNCLVDFGAKAGLHPNLSKSSLFIARVTDCTIYRLL